MATVTLNDPAHSNTLSASMVTGLASVLTALSTDSTIRAVVLTGAGRSFCLGARIDDLEQCAQGPPDEVAARTEARLAELATVIRCIRSLPCPVIAALNGQVAGAGLALALACDHRIATERTTLNLAYSRLGASTDGGVSWFLPRMIGHARALELLLGHTVLRGSQALQWGLVTTIVPRDSLLTAAHEHAASLATLAPHTVRAGKTLIDASLTSTLAEHMRREHELFAHGLQTDDMCRGLAAQREGSEPHFTGD
ncbi:enoyl-CoA hydratase/isomerase family protein [Actinomycetota bacterium Odt1-20B]